MRPTSGTGRPPPAWAAKLLADVWAAYAPNTPVPTLRWRRRAGFGSSGRSWPRMRHIVVTAGRDRHDARIVLLHEVAHCLRGLWPHGSRAGHDDLYWVLAWLLYSRFRGPVRMQEVVLREDSYRSTSTAVAASLGIRYAMGMRSDIAARRRTR